MESPLTRFSATAADYRRYRPSYPGALFDWIEAQSGVAPPARVLDLAAGTGIVTTALAARGHAVVAVDPNAAMLCCARDGVPAARCARMRAERLGLAGGAFALVTCGQAFHWFDAEVAVREIDRVLAPGGWAAAFWNVRGGGGIADDYDALLRRHSRDYAEVACQPSSLGDLREVLAGRAPRATELGNDHELDREALLGRARSASYVAHGVEDVAAFERDLLAAFERHARGGRVRFPYRTVALLWPAQ